MLLSCLTPAILGLSLYTHHFNPSPEISNSTPGIYLRTGCGLTLGEYKNSFGGKSHLLGWTGEQGPWGLTLGAITGYAQGTIPAVLPSVAFSPLPSSPSLRIRLTALLPAPKVNKHPGIHLSTEWRF